MCRQPAMSQHHEHARMTQARSRVAIKVEPLCRPVKALVSSNRSVLNNCCQDATATLNLHVCSELASFLVPRRSHPCEAPLPQTPAGMR
jgi:hypothetical protein